MHVIVIFGILLLIIFRIIGLLISIEFFHDFKELKFKILIIGWSVWIISGCSALLVGLYENQPIREVFLLINGISTSFAILFVLLGLYSYFQEISKKSITIFSVISLVLPLITFFMRLFAYPNFFDLTSGIVFIFVFVYSFLPLKKLEVFKKDLSIKSYYWYLIFIISVYVFIVFYVVIILQGYSFGFYSNEFNIPMFLNYLFGIMNNIIMLIYSIHLEYDISRVQKYELRDKYSHDLGNLIQVIYSATDLTNVDGDLTKDKAENLEIIQKKCEEAAKIIKEIKTLK